MSHALTMNADGTYGCAYVGETPWHRLGTELQPDATPQEMMIAAGLDWKVVERDTFVNFNGKTQKTGQKALLRADNGHVLTHVGKNWHPVQNETAFNFFEEFVSSGNMQMHTAGSLYDGEIMWVQAKIEGGFELFGGDTVEPFLLFSNPHQYGKTVNVRFTPTRTVCQNTLSLALSQKAKVEVSLNHRKVFDTEEVKKMLGLAEFKLTQYKEMAEFLGSKRTTEETMTQYFGDLLGTTNVASRKGELSPTAKRAMEIVETQPGAEFAAGSWWSAFNTITYMTDHFKGRTDEARLASAWYGPGAVLKTKALEKAMEYAEAA